MLGDKTVEKIKEKGRNAFNCTCGRRWGLQPDARASRDKQDVAKSDQSGYATLQLPWPSRDQLGFVLGMKEALRALGRESRKMAFPRCRVLPCAEENRLLSAEERRTEYEHAAQWSGECVAAGCPSWAVRVVSTANCGRD